MNAQTFGKIRNAVGFSKHLIFFTICGRLQYQPANPRIEWLNRIYGSRHCWKYQNLEGKAPMSGCLTVREHKMVNWQRFEPSDFEYDFEKDKLYAHYVTFNEAVECFFSDYEIRRNKRYRDRYQLIGRTIGGRKLKIIFQLKPKNVVRIITGWPI